MTQERLSEIFDDCFEFEDIPVSIRKKKGHRELQTTININLLYLNEYGMYCFVDDISDAPAIFYALQSKFKITSGIHIFNDISYYDNETSNVVKLEEFYEQLENFKNNHQIPESEKHQYQLKTAGDYFTTEYVPVNEEDENEDYRYIRPVFSDAKISVMLDTLDNTADETIYDGSYIYYPDGSVKVKKYVAKGFDTGGVFLFPCSDENPDKKFWLTVLGGWCGIHKFMERKWLQGILCLLTCGVGGVFYLFDLLSMLMGNYSYEDVHYTMENNAVKRSSQKYYMRPVSNKLKCFGGILLAVLITVIVSVVVYRPAFMALVSLLSTIDVDSFVNNSDIINQIG